MYIECFLHSHAVSGEYLGFDGINDIFGFNGHDLTMINSDFNKEIKESIPQDVWNFVRDSVFRVTYDVRDGKAVPTCIERIQPVFRI